MGLAALDVGDARIGVAVSDDLGVSVRGIGVVRRQGGSHDLAALARVLAPHEVTFLVIGLPLNMDGTEGRQATRVRAFGARLSAGDDGAPPPGLEIGAGDRARAKH